MTDRLWRWNDVAGTLVVAEEDGDPVTLADSWHVVDGRVRGFGLHRARFSRACQTWGEPRAADAGLWRSVVAALPARGAWFPRIELATGRRRDLRLRLRPAPEVRRTAAVWVPPFADRREHPGFKGPDLAGLLRLREQARRHGADEALLVTDDGVVTEAATSNVLWWDGARLCLPDPSLPALRGVTEALIVAEARRRGVPVRYCRRSPAQLVGHEVWLTNALHGIRVVSSWDGQPATTGVTPRAREWQRRLESMAAVPAVDR